MRGVNTIEYLEAKIVEAHDACRLSLEKWRAGDNAASKSLCKAASFLYELTFAAMTCANVMESCLLQSLQDFTELLTLGASAPDPIARQSSLRALKRPRN